MPTPPATRFRRRQLLGARLRWLVDVRLGGRTLRLADETLPVTSTELGMDLAYEGRLEAIALTSTLALFADTPEAGRCEVETTLPVDLVAMLARGYQLEGATASVSQWIVGTSYEERVPRLVGRVAGVRYGEAGEPCTFRIEGSPIDEQGSLLDPDAVVSADTWPSASEGALGRVYPVVFGIPGAYPSTLTSGSPALPVEVTSGLVDTLLICGAPVAASTVTIISTGNNSNVSLPVSHQQDGAGRRVAVVDISGQADAFRGDSSSFYARWDGGGGIWNDTHTRYRSTLGELLTWAFRRSTLPIDLGRLAVAVPLLRQRRVDGYVDQVVSPWDWVREQLLPIAPISMATGPGGLYPFVWRDDLREVDAVAHLDLDADPTLDRTGDLAEERVEPVNRVTVNYALRVRTGAYQGSYRVEKNVAARNSQLRNTPAGRSVVYAEQVLELPLVYDRATAARAALDRIAMVALPAQPLTVLAPSPTWEWVEPGMTVLVTGSRLHLARAVFFVETVERGGEVVGLSLRRQLDPVRDIPEAA